MKKIYLMLLCFLTGVGYSYSQNMVTTNPPLAGGNGSGGVAFNAGATGQAINIDSMRVALYGSGTQNVEVWYNPTPINGAPNISAANGWTLVTTHAVNVNNPNFTNPSLFSIPFPSPVLIPAGQTFGFFVGATSGVSVAYTTYSSGQTVFTDGTLSINTGNNVGYGGNAPTPTFHVRQFNGALYWSPDITAPYDAGVKDIIPANFCAGNTTLSAIIQNYGDSVLTGLTINWSVNGVSQSPVTYTGTLDTLNGSGQSSDTVALGSYNFISGNVYTIQAYTINPNGVADTMNTNDTTILVTSPALSGTFTIGGTTPDFPDFTTAVNALNNYGVCAPVTFNVRQGTYNEQIAFGNYGGASTYPVVFQPDPTNTSPAELIFAPSASNANYTVLFDNGAQNITIKNLEISTSGTTYSTVFRFGNTHTITIDSNVVTGYAGSTSSNASVFFNTSGMVADSITISNNIIDKGSYAFYWYGGSSSAPELNNKILNNTVTGFYYVGVYAYYQEDIDIIGNLFQNDGTYTFPYMMQIYFSNEFKINKNDIQMSTSSGGYGAYIYYSNYYYTGSQKSEVNNNFISVTGTSTGSPYGFYIYNPTKVDFAFNSIHMATGGTGAYATYFYASASDNIFQNNILANTAGGITAYITGSTAGVDVGYNNLYTTGSVLGTYNGTANNISQWNTNAGDNTSISVNPMFVSATDLHANHTSLNAAANAISYVVDDIDGDVRPTNPDIGADEFTPLALDAGVSVIDSPGVVACNLGAIYATIMNFGTNILDTVTVNWGVNGTPIGSTVFTGLNLASAEDTMLSLGTTTLTTGDVVTVFTTYPNGVMENAQGGWNDTAVRTIGQPGMSGTYTIGGPGADYYSYTAAIADIMTFGLCSSVEFLVNDSTYNENLSIGVIDGVSPTKTITFRSASGDSTQSILTSSANSFSMNYTIQFGGASYITFKDITIENTSVSYPRVLDFIGGSSYITFSNCIITNTVSSTSSTRTLIYSGSGASDDYITFENNVIKGGSYGIYWYGGGQGAEAKGFVLNNNHIYDQYYRGIYTYYTDAPKITNNLIETTTSYTGLVYTLAVYYSKGAFEITGNSLLDTSNSYGYKMYLYYSNGGNSVNQRGLVANNFIQAGRPTSSSYHYGMYGYNNTNLDIHHNTWGISGTSSSNRGLYLANGGNVELLNNIFASESGYGAYISGAYITNSDHNNFYVPNGNTGYYNGLHSNLSSWQAASGMDANSMEVNPNFVAYHDLHVCNDSLNGAAYPTGLTLDIDGDIRSLATPDIGADEFTGMRPDIGPDTAVCVGTPVTLSMTGASNTSFVWSTGETTTSIVTTAPGAYWVDATSTCGTGSDTIIVSYKPNPTAGFTQTISYLTGIFNNTSNNATGYLWDFGDGNTSTSPNPTYIFANSGYHNVTLYATNECGTDSITFPILLEIVNVAENTLGSNINVFPNPGNGLFNIVLEGAEAGNYTVNVTNLQGQIVYESVAEVNGNAWTHQADLQGLSRGVYMLSIRGPQGVGTARIVIN